MALITVESGIDSLMDDIRIHYGFDSVCEYDFYTAQYVGYIGGERFTIADNKLYRSAAEVLDVVATMLTMLCVQIELSKSERSGYW